MVATNIVMYCNSTGAEYRDATYKRSQHGKVLPSKLLHANFYLMKMNIEQQF